MIEANPTPKHHFDDKPIGLQRCTKPSKHSLFQQPASAVEGTVNRLIGRRMCKGQHMCWSKRGAHLLLQVRCAALNGDLLAGFQRWFPSVATRRIMMPWDWLPHRS
jgi:hypothetical protein